MDYEKYLRTLHPRTVSHENVIDAIRYCYGTYDALVVSRDNDSANRIAHNFISDSNNAYVDAFIAFINDDISSEEFWYTLYWYVECGIYAIEKDETVATDDEKEELFQSFCNVVYLSHIEELAEVVNILQELIYKI